MNFQKIAGLGILGIAGFLGYKSLSSDEETAFSGGGGGVLTSGATSTGESKANTTSASGEPNIIVKYQYDDFTEEKKPTTKKEKSSRDVGKMNVTDKGLEITEGKLGKYSTVMGRLEDKAKPITKKERNIDLGIIKRSPIDVIGGWFRR